ncbi:MAG: hypothetical protein JWO09_3663 [Bacteroidetes bacterium]|nr:hypothetical protein [Bacteroidota bacterium]
MSKKKSTASGNKQELSSKIKTSKKDLNKKPGPTGAIPFNSTTDQLLKYLVVNSITGPTGPTGKDGKDGVTGATGKDGKDGVTGATGKDGIDGKDGKDGATGATGNDGTDGKDGKDGATGATGKDGTDGKDGKDGATGATGTDGTDGTNGKDGVTGATGKDGTDGKDGKDGVTGATGKDGTNGTNGKDGVTGATGKDGTNGSNGKDGVTGAPGKDGATGHGERGPTGPTGAGIEADVIILRKTNQSMSGFVPLNIVVTGNTVTGFWNEAPRPDAFVCNAGTVVDPHSKSIYLIGGVAGVTKVKLVQHFNTKEKEWKMHSSIPDALTFPAATMYTNKLVYAGGDLDGAISNKVYIFDGTWRLMGELPKPVSAATAVEYRGKLYVLGGRDKKNAITPCKYIQVYDPESRSWSFVDTQVVSFATASAAVYQDKIYVFGGHSVNASGALIPMPVMAYHPPTNLWTQIAAHPTTLIYESALMIDDTIYYIGGSFFESFDDPSSSCFAYNVVSKSMKTVQTTLKTPRRNASGAVVDRCMFIMGGTGPTGTFKTEYLDPDDYQFYLHKRI